MAKNKSISFWLFPSVLILFLILASVASAENVTLIKEYTYTVSDIDSKVSSRAIALEQVKRALLDQLGTYLISETEVKNYQITKDQVTTLTAGIVSAEVVEEKWDGRTFYLKAKISADPKEVAKSVDALRTDVQKSKDLEDSKKKAEESIREVERLKKELDLVRADSNKQREYANAIKDLSATDWFDKGYAFHRASKFNDEIDAYDKAIELNPQLADAYFNRGKAYYDLGNNQQAIKNYDKAIELNPRDAEAYVNRGLVYNASGNKGQAVNDFSKAIELNPNLALAYYNRGTIYYTLENEEQALNDFNKALKLNPEDAMTYYNRGNVYGALGNYQQAIKDFNKAIKVNPKFANAYNSRGNAYSALGNHYQQAIHDFDKALELNPKLALAYYNRGIAYNYLGNNNMFIQNLKMAAQLGLTEAQQYLGTKGVEY